MQFLYYQTTNSGKSNCLFLVIFRPTLIIIRSYFFSALFLLTLCIHSQNIDPVQRFFWGIGVDQFYNAKILSSGNIALVGRTDSHRKGGYQNKDGWILMLSPEGDTLWSRAYGGESRTDRFWDIEEKPSGDLLLAGSSGSFGGSENAYVVQIDSSGNIRDSYNYGDDSFDTVHDLELLEDGGWIMVGESKSPGKKEDAVFQMILISADSCGKPIWMQKITSKGESFGAKISAQKNGKVYVLGKIKIENVFHSMLHCYDLNGELSFAKTYKGTAKQGDHPLDMVFKSDEKILITGFTIDSTYNGFLLEIDTLGKVNESYTYHSKKDLEFFSIGLSDDGTQWLAGYCTKHAKSSFGSLLQLNAEYEVIKGRSFLPRTYDVYFSTIRFLPNKRLLLAGSHTNWYGTDLGGYFVVADQEAEPVVYESKLSVNRKSYKIKLYDVDFKIEAIKGFDYVPSLQIPVKIHDLIVSDDDN